MNWRPVSVPPPNGEFVLVWLSAEGRGRADLGSFSERGWTGRGMGPFRPSFKEGVVTHWMPLPDGPGGVSESDRP